jgi:ribosome-binding factor A
VASHGLIILLAASRLYKSPELEMVASNQSENLLRLATLTPTPKNYLAAQLNFTEDQSIREGESFQTIVSI